jgi:hypothetical protein
MESDGTNTVTHDVRDISAIIDCLQTATQTPHPPSTTPSLMDEINNIKMGFSFPTVSSSTHYDLNWVVFLFLLVPAIYSLWLTIQSYLRERNGEPWGNESTWTRPLSTLLRLLIAVPTVPGIFLGMGTLLETMRATLFDGWFGWFGKIFICLLGAAWFVDLLDYQEERELELERRRMWMLELESPRQKETREKEGLEVVPGDWVDLGKSRHR